MQDSGVIVTDEAHAAHIGCQGVHLVHAAGGLQAVVPAAQVEDFEFVGVGGFVFVLLDVYATNPVPLQPQISQDYHRFLFRVISGFGIIRSFERVLRMAH